MVIHSEEFNIFAIVLLGTTIQDGGIGIRSNTKAVSYASAFVN